MSWRNWRVPAAAAAILLAAAPALAQTPLPPTPAEDPLNNHDAKRLDRMEKVLRELRAIVYQGKDTGKPVVVQFADTDGRIQELSNRLSDLEQSLTRLNGQLETTTYNLDQARKANADLQAQVKALGDQMTQQQAQAAQAPASAGGPPPPPGPPGQGAPPPQGPPPSAADAFANARQLMMSGDYDAAEQAFGAYVEAYPDGARTPEARYWWGKTLSARSANAQAATAYIGAIRGWPKTAWAPDAVVELARSLTALNKAQDACATLAELPKRYPKATAAVSARAAAASRQARCGG